VLLVKWMWRWVGVGGLRHPLLPVCHEGVCLLLRSLGVCGRSPALERKSCLLLCRGQKVPV